MKKLIPVLFLFCIAACEGSSSYRGNWKAVDDKETHFELIFEADKLQIIDSSGNINTFNYTQNSVAISNGISTYGIEISDGRSYSITFPKKGDKSIALIKSPDENIVYTISRNKYITHKDIYKLNEN